MTLLTCCQQLLLALAITYLWPPTLTKLAIIILYHRLNPAAWFRWSLYLVAFVLVGYTSVFTILFCDPCNPLKPGAGDCLTTIALWQAILNIATDIVLIALPIPTLWVLQMSVKQKVILGLLFTLGSGYVSISNSASGLEIKLTVTSSVMFASIIRFQYVMRMINNPDVTWTQASAAVWSIVEINIGLLCNCLSVLRSFVKQYIPRLLSFSSPSSKGPSRSKSSIFSKKKNNLGYQLDSISNKDQVYRKTDIVVSQDYIIQTNQKQRDGDGDSTEEIMPGGGHRM